MASCVNSWPGPVPMLFVCAFVDLLLPYQASMVNTSLAEERLPLSQRHAIVSSLRSGSPPFCRNGHRGSPMTLGCFPLSVQRAACAVRRGPSRQCPACLVHRRTVPSCHLPSRHQLHQHMYADVSQVCASMPPNDTAASVVGFSACIADINDWINASRLRLKG